MCEILFGDKLKLIKARKKKNRLPTAIGKAAQKNNCKYILNCLSKNVKRLRKEMSDAFF